MRIRTQIWSVASVVVLGNEPLSKWSLVTNSQSRLWGRMLIKYQNCHFIASNYRLACRPFNDQLQLCLQCIRESVKSHFCEEHTHAHVIVNLHKHTMCGFLSKASDFLFICEKNGDSFEQFRLTCQSKAEQDKCNYNSSELHKFWNYSTTISNNFKFFIINQEWGSSKKGLVGGWWDGWRIAVQRGGTHWWGSPALCLIAVSECTCKKGALH